jgi:hypothetical protein
VAENRWFERAAASCVIGIYGDFAEYNELITMRAVLGFHRRLQGQLSEDRDGYYREIDHIIDSKKRFKH